MIVDNKSRHTRLEIILVVISGIGIAIVANWIIYPQLISQLNSNGANEHFSVTSQLTIKFYDHNATSVNWHLVLPTWLGGEGYTPSCYYWCHGITYEKIVSV